MYLLSLTKIHFSHLILLLLIESFKFQSYSIQAFCQILFLKKLSLSMQLTNEKIFCEKNSYIKNL